MQTVIVRLAGPAVDGRLHGVIEVVGAGAAMGAGDVVPFADDDALLRLLHSASAAAGIEERHGGGGVADLNPT